MDLPRPESWPDYVRRIGPPRAVPCDIVLGSVRTTAWYCRSHDYGFWDRPYPLDHAVAFRLSDRCPVSRLEEWRARRWEAAA